MSKTIFDQFLDAVERELNVLLPTTTVILRGRYPTCALASADNLGGCVRGGVQGIPIVMYIYLYEQATAACVPDQRGTCASVVGNKLNALPMYVWLKTDLLAKQKPSNIYIYIYIYIYIHWCAMMK